MLRKIPQGVVEVTSNKNSAVWMRFLEVLKMLSHRIVLPLRGWVGDALFFKILRQTRVQSHRAS